MKLYFAGAETWLWLFNKIGSSKVLMSYYYAKNKPKNIYQEVKDYNHDLFVDSGAFSAHTSKVGININGYIKFIKEIDPPLYASLDVIGDAEKTKENLKYMEEAGLKPIPTFHRGSEFDYLYYYIDNYDYIALGGLAGLDVGQGQRLLFLDRVWGQILKRNPDLKVHGFGCGGTKILKTYSWYSADTASWIAATKFGRPVDGFSNEEIIKIYTEENPEEDVWKTQHKHEIILTESIKFLMKIEREVNEEHKISKFTSTMQQDFFD